MQPQLRQEFNKNFTAEKYQAYMAEIENLHPGSLDFRNAETPVFISKSFTKKMLDACESIIDVILQPDFKTFTERAIPPQLKVPNENEQSRLENSRVEITKM